MNIGYDPDYDYLFDPQQGKPVCFCQRCGREIYRFGIDIHPECEGGADDGDEK